MSDTLTQLAYQTFQQGKSVFGLAHKTISSQLLNLISPPINELRTNPIDPKLLLEIQQRLNRIIETDWQDAQRGVYPAALLFDNPWEDFFRYYPALWLDTLTIWQRANQKKYQDFSPGIETEGYPSYYLQNFHHQTDGYLSDMSANLYDLQVEILFNGSADAMRRRVLAPLKEGLKAFNSLPQKQIKVLDIACGTGRTLKFIRGMLPQVSLFGMDLSPAYLRKANQLLSENPGELPQLIQANAEDLPYRDNYFQGVTSVFLFHELPPAARQQVIEQAFRVTQPGGVFVICDSIQAIDSPEMMPLMENFPAMFHEPFYRHYTTDDLVERLKQAGFQDIATENHFMSKYWVARKPQ
ncbi:MAG: class I SAM-dependent methyltransferase [Microcoleus sp. SIO2G3]|nr:class I SAM-dependent methyltransferase [Microcoleus sp. SIO2G3]